VRVLTRDYARRILELDTPHGPARPHLHLVDSPVAALVLRHGAGGRIDSPDLAQPPAAATRGSPSRAHEAASAARDYDRLADIGFACARRGFERPCETLVGWARQA
jgi:hypothetical protein